MTLRMRYYLAILPLFAGLGLINGMLVLYLERSELLWGLEQRAQGSAVVLAGFWKAAMGEETDAGSSERRDQQLAAFSQRLGGVSVSWLQRDGDNWSRRLLHADRSHEAPPVPEARVFEELRRTGSAVRFVARPEADSDLSIGYAQLRLSSAHQLESVLVVSTTDRSLRDAMAALTRRLIVLVALLILVGVVVAEWITRLARSELKLLDRAASELSSGRYTQQWSPGRIKELNDLGGTLLTMTSLLADGSHQTRRRFFQSEPLPGDVDLAEAYRQERDSLTQAAMKKLACCYKQLGQASPEDFIGVRISTQGCFLVVGRCAPAPARLSLLERMVRADATLEFLLGVAQSRPAGPSWSDALKACPCEKLQVLFNPGVHKPPSGWELDPVRAGPRAYAPSQAREILGTLSEDARKIARVYTHQFSSHPLEQLADDLAGLLTPRYSGLLVICDFPALAPATEADA